jgi:phosphoadenosine phosphosulfate reductase
VLLPNAMPAAQHLLFELHSRLSVFQRKVERAQKIVSEALAQMKNPYIGASTGKDSWVTAHLVWEQHPDIPAVYFDADAPFPESIEFLDYLAEQHTVIKWKTEPILDVFERLGGPTAPNIDFLTMEATVYAPIRALLAEKHYDGVFLGLQALESEGRAKSIKFHGKIYRYKRDGVLRCLPIADWDYRDVWGYIVSRGLCYNRVYDKMWDMAISEQRVSYWAGETKARWGRWVFLKRHYPDLWNAFAQRFPEVRSYC